SFPTRRSSDLPELFLISQVLLLLLFLQTNPLQPVVSLLLPAALPIYQHFHVPSVSVSYHLLFPVHGFQVFVFQYLIVFLLALAHTLLQQLLSLVEFGLVFYHPLYLSFYENQQYSFHVDISLCNLLHLIQLTLFLFPIYFTI